MFLKNPWFLVLLALCAGPALLRADWRPVSTSGVKLQPDGDSGWKISSQQDDEFDLTSKQELKARTGDTFEIKLRIRVNLHTRALPELECYDAAGKEIEVASALDSGPSVSTTNWQSFRRVFAVRPGTATVRARVRAAGRGEIGLADLEFRPIKTDTYQTGALIEPMYPKLRKGLVLESNLGVVNTELLSEADRDGDGKWAVIYADLDKLSEPEQRGEDWRTKFEYRPNEIYWSDGAVLKSDSVQRDRPADFTKALHFRMKIHAGPYRVIVSDPGRAVAVSTNGKTWKRYEGGSEPDLGTMAVKDGILEFWLDACYRDPVTVGPVYFDYVRVLPKDNAPSVDKLFDAANKKPERVLRGSVEDQIVRVSVQATQFQGGANWPVRCGLPIPQGELVSAENAAVLDTTGRALPSQNRAVATWPDGSVKWLYLDFRHDFSSSPNGQYSVAYGNRRKRIAPSASLQIQESAAGLEVATGAIRFTVPKARFGLLENVRTSGGKLLQREPIGIDIAEAGGAKWRALDLQLEQIRVEQSGPLHAVILVETNLPPSGAKAQGFAHRARIHVYANSPLVEIDYFVANTDSRKQLKVRSISMSVKTTGRGQGSGASIQATAGEKASGTVSLGGEANLSAGVEAFREQYPKALRWSPEGLQIDLWAPEGGDYDWIQGVGKTHHIALFYGAARGDDSLLAHCPVLALAEPQWYTSSKALGLIDTATHSPLPELEKTLNQHMDATVVGRVGLGFENYGDHSSSGYVKGTYLWDDNEYDLPAGAFVHFARTGDRAALRLALASALHYVDVDVIHYSSNNAAWSGAPHTHSHGTVGHHTAENPGMSHAGYVQGLIWYSYFTGDPDGIAGARGIADWVLNTIKPEGTMGTMERAMGHPMMTLTDVYEATWDERYLRGSARLVDWATKWEHPVRSGFLAPITEQPAFISQSPFCGGLLVSALLKFNSWARLAEIDALLERAARSTLTDMWRPPMNIMSKGGSPRRGSGPQNISTHLRVIRHEYLRTGDPLFLVVPREAVAGGFSGTGKDFGTRSTGLVFNYVPWFLSLLNEKGDPKPEPELTVTPRQDAINLQRGAQSKVCFAVRNAGSAPISKLRASFQPRLDISVVGQATVPAELAAGAHLDLCYDVQAPERINLSTDYNRTSYAHWSAIYERTGKPHLAHSWVRINVTAP